MTRGHASVSLLLRRLLIAFAAAVLGWAQPFDIVLREGRVMDPESGVDAVRNIGIQGKSIAAITMEPIRGREEIDARGLVVSAGFIDLHCHGQTPEAYALRVRDGVTTALELEIGVDPIRPWYAAREGKSLIHHGASAGHIPARMIVMKDTGAWLPQDHAVTRTATLEERKNVAARLDKALGEGGLGIGFGFNYTPKALHEEMQELFALAAQYKRPAFVHMRYGSVGEPGIVLSLHEVIAYAAVTGASVHVVHFGASSTTKFGVAMAIVEGARERRLDLSLESYPYTAGMTRIETAIFNPGFQQQLGLDYKDMLWAETGERLNEQTFAEYRKKGGLVATFTNTEEMIRKNMAHPLIMVASDGIIDQGKGHPRAAGTCARVLGKYVREEKALSLMEALRKMALMPAQRLEQMSPQMRNKGRIRLGADADLTLFDPQKVIDRATYSRPNIPSDGIPYVMVEGTFVVRKSQLVEGVFPGKGIVAR